MLRAAVLVLLLANAGYYAWAQGLLRDWGLAPAEQSEPQRLEQQIQPENLRIGRPVSGDAASAPASPPPVAPSSSPTPASEASHPAPTSAVPAQAAAADSTACLQAGPFDARQTEALRTAAAALPANSWSLEPVSFASRWMVYMGRFADEDALEKKRAELRARKVAYDRPGPALEPGLSLGRFSTEEAAERALAALGTQGVRTARVVQERSDATGHVLRLPAATPALRAQAETQLRTALAGRPLRNCG
ncbi:SPOR domain-containing protein [Acidovorax sp. NCPPB 3859]|nr:MULTISPECIES: SPOR domain-containing protein [unclassified Acidovorax]MDA8452703.1 SPOR domain-containing protein [Acidovorax sp. GBBC 3297]MDA8462088.1 SPOR domain-containing protein [Acidovorax sp. GBBC 3333]MDA8467144.1 SPOR domain-containing protein [Acidovorax sp. GBBC 3332]MDA8472179.1 SPOR domain-containing protein [Acidovorax sp. GBBC 3299]WCM78505.1 SPOR domain-containing protein [Acidovorax sp. GBBC 712]